MQHRGFLNFVRLRSGRAYLTAMISAVAPWRHYIIAATLVLMTPCVGAQTVTECVKEIDSDRRLACYDHLFRDGQEASVSDPSLAITTPSDASRVTADLEDSEPQTLAATTPLTKFWELSPTEKRGTFVVRTYMPNFVLPLHYTSNINRAPSSPTRPPDGIKNNYRPIEAKLQISLRAKIAEDLLLPNADLWFAYTQCSLWQVWDSGDSAPFRSTDYQPEAIYVIPVPQRLAAMPDGWQWHMVQLGFAHQSNGQSNPLSRSWNRIYAGAAFDRGELGLQVRLNRRLNESSADDNPDLIHYIGNTEFMASWLPGRAAASLNWRTGPDSLHRGSLQLDWTYPVYSDQPAGLRLYVQLFTGYGETLLDYNHRQTSLGVGLALFQF